jgi:acyl-CoA synthetase (AMP-forming)/AMP-acid ligase II
VGKPKAVMLSHDNLTWDAVSISQRLDIKKGEEIIVSYLPLSHVAAQVVDIYLVMLNAACIYFADPNALKGSLINTLQEAQPTKFLGVPRVWEKMHEKMMQNRRPKHRNQESSIVVGQKPSLATPPEQDERVRCRPRRSKNHPSLAGLIATVGDTVWRVPSSSRRSSKPWG